jgi:hypothetical protein
MMTPGAAAPAALTSWSFNSTSLVPTSSEFGNVVYDPEAKLWRLFYSAKSAIFFSTGTGPTTFSNNPKVALALGATGSWDAFSMNVPYVWYETGQTRPWRMLYRGGSGSSGLATSKYQIGLATAGPEVGGVINWQREDTRGNALTGPVLAESTTGWAANKLIDFGSVMKYGGNYYLYYDTVPSPREVGLATSTDLVRWVQYPLNPLYKGVVNTTAANQGPDEHYAGTADPTDGFYCPDIVFWPTSAQPSRFVMFVPHYSGSGNYASLDVFTSNSPVFLQSYRTYTGKALTTRGSTMKLDGSSLDGSDTPRIITDDISRNVATTTVTGGQVVMPVTVETSEFSWLMTSMTQAR